MFKSVQAVITFDEATKSGILQNVNKEYLCFLFVVICFLSGLACDYRIYELLAHHINSANSRGVAHTR